MANGLEMMLSTEVELLQAENARLREENKAFESDVETIAAHNIELQEQLAAAQATIEQMREALTEVVDADECQDADGWLCFELSAEAYHRADAALSIHCNLDALHEARALECERLKNRYRENSPCSWWLDEEAAAHRARKENSHE